VPPALATQKRTSAGTPYAEGTGLDCRIPSTRLNLHTLGYSPRGTSAGSGYGYVRFVTIPFSRARGGLNAAAGAAMFGLDVCLIEKERLGGDCLWWGCVPSKTLIHSAKVAHTVKTADKYGVVAKGAPNFSNVMKHMHDVQAGIAEHDSPERFEELGCTVLFGSPSFIDKHHLVLGKEKVKARKFIIATGSSPVIPPIPGLEETKALTNIGVLSLRKLPKSMIIIGGGPIGIEFAQAFQRLGCQIAVVNRGPTILGKEDPEVGELMKSVLEEEGIKIFNNAETTKISKENTHKIVEAVSEGKRIILKAEEILLAVGRKPNIEELNLESAGVKYDKKGIKVNRKCQTSTRNIYAVGDVAGPYLFTHYAEHMAGIAISNAIFHVPRKVSSIVPWTTFTDPEVARVGMTEAEALAKYGEKVEVFKKEFKEIDRARCEEATKGFAKLVARGQKILGVTIVGPSAGDYINEYVLAMKTGKKLGDISSSIHVYPTLGEINKRVADKYFTKKLFTPFIKKLARFLIKL